MRDLTIAECELVSGGVNPLSQQETQPQPTQGQQSGPPSPVSPTVDQNGFGVKYEGSNTSFTIQSTYGGDIYATGSMQIGPGTLTGTLSTGSDASGAPANPSYSPVGLPTNNGVSGNLHYSIPIGSGG